MADTSNTALLDIANNGAALNQALSELTTNVAKLSEITLPAANGGTGLTSSGASGNVLTSNGTAWVSSALPTPAANVSSITFGTTGLTPSTASTGAVSVAGTLNVANGGTGLSSLTAYGVLCGGTTTTGAAQSLATGSSGQVLTSNGASSLPSWQNRLVLETAKAYNWNGSSSNTNLDFTNLPSWVKRITVMFNELSVSGTSPLRIRLGYGSTPTYQTSGYTGAAGNRSSEVFFTAGFDLNYANLNSSLWSGNVVITNFSGNAWTELGITGANNSAPATTAGYVLLSGALTAVRVTTVNGSDVFDNGSVNIMYE